MMTTHKTLPEKFKGIDIGNGINEFTDAEGKINEIIDFLSQEEVKPGGAGSVGKVINGFGGQGSIVATVNIPSSPDENGVIDYGSKSQNEAFNIPSPQTESWEVEFNGRFGEFFTESVTHTRFNETHIKEFIHKLLSQKDTEVEELIKKMRPKFLFQDDMYQHNRNVERENVLNELLSKLKGDK